jgi:hypothetical protein
MEHCPLSLVYNHTVKRILRTLLLWLMMLALPTQGMAAATLLYCGPVHAGGATSTPVRPSEVAAAHAEHGHAHMHASRQAGHVHSDHAQAELADASAHSMTPAVDTACSVCAACCSATAIMAKPLFMPAQAEPLAPVRAGTALAVDFFTDGPRRPPRTFLA